MPLFENNVRFQTPQAIVRSRPSSPPPLQRPSPRQMVTIRPEDQEPLHHYLSTMVQFAKIRSSASDNIYSYIFTNMTLTHAPLYEAILSWAALHLAHVKSHSTEDAELRYKRAVKLLNEDAQVAECIDLTFVTVWILLQYDLFSASGVDEFISLLNYAADVVEAVFWNSDAVIRDQLGPVGIRTLMWLSAYDVHAALFGHSCRLLRCLKMHSSTYDIIEGYGESPGNRAVSSIEFGAAELKICLRLVLQINIARGSCVLLGKWQGDMEGIQIAWEAVRSNLNAVQVEAECGRTGSQN
jgi:Fungal specific transcription factor domain